MTDYARDSIDHYFSSFLPIVRGEVKNISEFMLYLDKRMNIVNRDLNGVEGFVDKLNRQNSSIQELITVMEDESKKNKIEIE